MAERRMFAKTIIDSDAFLEMPISSQLLYFHLSMRADDEGFINKPKTIMRMIGSKDDDLRVLITRKFIIPFESGVVVIKHWRIHNYIRGDRLHETKYLDEKASLFFDDNGAYTTCQSNVSQLVGSCPTEVRLGKDSIVKDNIKNSHFEPPTLEEVQLYCKERNNKVDVERFIDFYESKGWMVGKNNMKDWKACVRTWEKDSKQSKQPQPNSNNKFNSFPQRQYTPDQYAEIEHILFNRN